MTELTEFINKENIDLVVWDLDGVIFDLDWDYQETPQNFLQRLYNAIIKIDQSIIKDESEFIARLFPYPEINEIGIKYGKEAQLEVKSLYKDKEMFAIDRAFPHNDVIDFIKYLQKPQVIWSNNYSNTIEYLVKKAGIENNIEFIASLDKVILSKPDGEGFNLIQKQFPNIQKENMVIVGDSLKSDKVAAENSGIKFFHYIKEK